MKVTHLFVVALLAVTPRAPALAQAKSAAPSAAHIAIDARAASTPFPHFWEQMFGSGRANLVLRQNYRKDLQAVHAITDFEYIRGHGILDDENGVYSEDEHGNPIYNFAYVDQIYDGLLSEHVRPVVELSFMPKKLAFNPDALHPFWYKPNVSPPKSIERWDALIMALAHNLVDRYGVEEVAHWYFEVWNEPNIDFWGGIPRDRSYFELYDHTARALKAVSPRLRVGGPATAAADWITPFLAYVHQHGSPIDFVSTHGYADDTIENLFPPDQSLPVPRPPDNTPEDDRVCLAIGKVRAQIKAAGRQDLPLFWTEWNVQGNSQSRDTTFVGPALASTIQQCDGMVQKMSFWTFSDVFEEGGPIPTPFQGNFGLRAEFGINKPSFYDFALLHQLGSQRLANPAKNILVTRTAEGTLAIAVWNLVDPPPQNGPALTSAQSTAATIVLHFTGIPSEAPVTIQKVDDEHGNVLPFYARLGRPTYPTPAQVEALNHSTALPPPQQLTLRGSELTLNLEPNALALIQIGGREK